MAHTNGIGSSTVLQTLLTQTDSATAAARKEQAAASASAATAAQDRTQLSATASALLQTSNDDARTQKVQALQNAVASGTYSVSAHDVADAVIRNLLG